MFIFIFFFIVFITLYGLLGLKVIGDLNGEISYNEFNNFADISYIMTILYSLITIDIYPESMIPSLY